MFLYIHSKQNRDHFAFLYLRDGFYLHVQLAVYTPSASVAFYLNQSGPVLNCGFLRSIATPLDGLLVHRRVTPSTFAGTHLYTWVMRSTVRVKCLA